MANFSGKNDMCLHIRYGDAVPARSFPDSKAARRYVLSGVDKALELIGARIRDYPTRLGERVNDQIHDIRDCLVAAPPHMGGIVAASMELRVLGVQARGMQEECRRRIRRAYLGMSMFIFFLVLGISVLPCNLGLCMFVIWQMLNESLGEKLSELKRKQDVAAEIERAAVMVAGIVKLLA